MSEELNDNDRVLTLLEAESISSLDYLLGPFTEPPPQTGELEHEFERFLRAFFAFADQFADKSCVGVAEIIRQNTSSNDLRGMTVKAIAKDLGVS